MDSISFSTPLGPVTISANDRGLTGLEFYAASNKGHNPLLAKAQSQVQEWFAGERKDFDLPLDLEGTEFQQAVWQQLAAIPWGETRTYGQVALAVDSPRASRAVGGACGANPLPIIIPCHRVLGSDGSLTGFSSGLDLKKKLLRLEGHKISC